MFLNSREDMGQMFHDLDHELDTQSRQTVNTLFFRHIVVPIASIFQMLPVTEFAREQATREVDAETAAFLFLGLMRDLKHMKVNPRADAQRADAVVDILLHGIVIRPA